MKKKNKLLSELNKRIESKKSVIETKEKKREEIDKYISGMSCDAEALEEKSKKLSENIDEKISFFENKLDLMKVEWDDMKKGEQKELNNKNDMKKEACKDIQRYKPESQTDDELLYDLEIVGSWYSTLMEGRGGSGFTKEDLIELAGTIHSEIRFRTNNKGISYLFDLDGADQYVREMYGEIESKVDLQRVRSPEIEKQGKQSQKEDKIVPFRYFKFPKPMHGRRKDEKYSIDATIRVIDKQWEKYNPYQQGIAVQKKYDGVTCLSGGAGIWTKNGYKRIRDIKIGDEVLTHKGRFRKVTNIFEREIKRSKESEDVFRVNLKGGSAFKITGNHSILSEYLTWIPISEYTFKRGVRPKIINKERKKILREVLIEDELGYSKNIKNINALLYFMGFFLGDGNLGRGKNRNRVSLYLSVNDDMEKILSIIKNVLDIPEHRITIYGPERTKKNMYHINWYDPTLRGWLSKCFYDEATGQKGKLPEWFDDLSKEQVLSFMKGWDESDTSVTTNSSIAGQIAILCLRSGIFTSLLRAKTSCQNGKRGYCYKVRIFSKNSSNKDFYGDSNFFYPRIWIEKLDSQHKPKRVYNLEVDEDNSYVVEGIAVHNCHAHKRGNKVLILTDDGGDVTNSIPTLVEQFKKEPKDFVLGFEAELVKDGKHFPRSVTNGLFHTKEVHPDEDKIIANIFDIVWYDGEDIHNKPYSERLKYMNKIKAVGNIKVAETRIARNEEALITNIRHFSNKEGSEGAILKLAESYKFELDGQSLTSMKYKKELYLNCKVVGRRKVKGDPNTYYYYLALKGDVLAGKSFNVRIDPKPAQVGDVLEIVFIDISKYTDPQTSEEWFGIWNPKVLGFTNEAVSTPEMALRHVKATTNRITEKRMPKDIRDAIKEGVIQTRRKIEAYDYMDIELTEEEVMYGLANEVIIKEFENETNL